MPCISSIDDRFSTKFRLIGANFREDWLGWPSCRQYTRYFKQLTLDSLTDSFGRRLFMFVTLRLKFSRLWRKSILFALGGTQIWCWINNYRLFGALRIHAGVIRKLFRICRQKRRKVNSRMSLSNPGSKQAGNVQLRDWRLVHTWKTVGSSFWGYVMPILELM